MRHQARDSRPLAAVTGGAGALGSHLVHALCEAGWRVRCLEHRRKVPRADEIVQGDVLEPNALERLLVGADACVHAAAVTHARSSAAYRRTNVGGTRAVAAAAERAGVRRLVHLSTSALAPDGGAYSRSKLEAERALAGSRVVVTILRLPEVYAAGGREGIDGLIARARAGRPLFVVGRGVHEVRPVHVDDVVAVVPRTLVSERAAGQTYTLAGESLSLRAFAEACLLAFGSSSRIVPVPEPLVAAAAVLARVLPLPLYPDQLARLRGSRPDPSPAAAPDLGFEPRPLGAGLAALAGLP